MAEPLTDSDERPIRYAARQPILAGDETVIGYKLFFRTNVKDHFSGRETNVSSLDTIDASGLLGLDVLCDRRLAFIGCTRDTLLEDSLAFLPPKGVVAEIGPEIVPDEAVRNVCRSLKNAGFQIALVDFSVNDPREPLLACTDFLKIDIKRRAWDETMHIARTYSDHGLGLIAEKVETREDFDQTRRAGFHYFQGYFFRRPETMRTRVATAQQTVYLRLLQAISRPELNWSEVEDIIKRDTALYYRLLRYINSAAIGMRNEVRSISQALTLMGENDLRRWCRMAGVFAMSKHRPSDLMLSTMVRARFGELMADRFEHDGADLFLVGILSLMDAILEIPMGAVINGLPLDDASRQLLLENQGLLRPFYDLVWALERGAWRPVVRICRKLGFEEEQIAACYSQSMEWAQAIASPGI